MVAHRQQGGDIIGGVSDQRAQTISYPAPGARASRLSPEYTAPHVIVLFGATGDLSRRKLLPGLAHLATSSKLAPDIRVVGTSLEPLNDEEFRAFAKTAIGEFGTHLLTDEQWETFSSRLTYLPMDTEPSALTAGCEIRSTSAAAVMVPSTPDATISTIPSNHCQK